MTRPSPPKRPVALARGEVLTVVPVGEGRLPQRRGGQARDRVAELTGLIAALIGEGAAIDALAYRKSLEARAPASVKALANDLACYADFVAAPAGLAFRRWRPALSRISRIARPAP